VIVKRERKSNLTDEMMREAGQLDFKDTGIYYRRVRNVRCWNVDGTHNASFFGAHDNLLDDLNIDGELF
jgi:hypothetical protein